MSTQAAAANPLIAQRVDPTRAWTGILLAEDVEGVVEGIRNGSWIEIGLGALGTGLDALAFVVDPFGSIAGSGVGWLIEHIGPLRRALDALAGDPAQITAFAQTWANVAKAAAAQAADLKPQLAGLDWTGFAADAYRGHAGMQVEVLESVSKAAEGLSGGVMAAGMLVAAVRSLVRDMIAQFIGKLVAWAAEAILTAGVGLIAVAEQAAYTVEQFSVRVANFLRKLTRSLQKLGELLMKLKAILGQLGERLRRLTAAKHEGEGTLRSCFVPGTPVLTPDGPRPIESLGIGDLVLAYDVDTAALRPQAVTATLVREVPVVLDLTVAGETITCSPEHPFWTPHEQRWCAAESLRPGTALLTAGGEVVKVDSVRQRPESVVPVHNITVDGLATYFVSAGRILVHNKATTVDPPKVAKAKNDMVEKLADLDGNITEARKRIDTSNLPQAKKADLHRKLDDIVERSEKLLDEVVSDKTLEAVAKRDAQRRALKSEFDEVELPHLATDPNPVPSNLQKAYDDVRAGTMRPNLDASGNPKVFRGDELTAAQKAGWVGSIEYVVPGPAGQHHRILQRPDGQLGYVLDHKYSVPRLFPGPWYPEGGVLPKKF